MKIAQKEKMLKAQADQCLRRGLILQQRANTEVHQMRSEVYAALHAQEAGFRQHAQNHMQHALERTEARKHCSFFSCAFVTQVVNHKEP